MTTDEPDAWEKAVQANEARYNTTLENVRDILRRKAPMAHQYLIDSEDNLDGWEGKEEAFYAVFFDMALYWTSQS